MNYLETPIVEAKRTDLPRWGMTADGYTVRSGAPTAIMVRLEGETRWRRLMVWQFSNAGTVFVRVLKQPFVIRNEWEINVLLEVTR